MALPQRFLMTSYIFALNKILFKSNHITQIGYFEKLHLVHKGTALSKQIPTTETKRAGRVPSLTSTTAQAWQVFKPLLSRFR